MTGHTVQAYALKTNGRHSPQEVDAYAPLRLTWRLRSEGATSERHRVVITDQRTSSVAWDSGWIDGDETAATCPVGAVTRISEYIWTLTVVAGGVERSATAVFSTGLERFTAEWIRRNPHPWFRDDGLPVDQRLPVDVGRSWRTMYSQPPLQLRTEVNVPGEVRRARLFATAEGVYQTFINGLRVGRYELTPGWTSYERRLDYQGYDVTELLRAGVNTWAAEVADGWWSGYLGYHTRKQAEQYGAAPAFLAELHIELTSGETVVHRTGRGWREKFGHRVMADLLMGEYHDHTVGTRGWLVGDDREGWRDVVVGGGTPHIRPQISEPITVIDQVEPVSVQRDHDEVLVDFGQNLVGRVELHVTGLEHGDVIRIRHGEILDGNVLYTENLRSAEALDIAVSDGGNLEFTPAFTLHGFRFVSITGLRASANITRLRAQVLSSDLEEVGSVSTSSPLVNQLLSNIRWSQRGNFVGIPTDCNQRDERLGWTADAQIFTPTAALNSDICAFMTSWLDDLAAAQAPDGRVPDVVPTPPTSLNFFDGAPAWGDAATIVPWHLYRTYGDLDQLRSRFEMMRGWVDYVSAQNPDGLWTQAVGNNYGDWLSVGADTPKPVVNLAYRIHSLDIVAEAAHVLGIPAIAGEYDRLARSLRQRFEAEYVSPDGEVLGDTQTGYLLALAWRLVGEERREALSERLVANIIDNGRLLSTGFLGVNLLCPTLTELGHHELALDLLLEERFPSWGFSIAHGATTIWERWDGWTPEGGFHTPAMNSFNHYSLGSVGEWLYRHLAGIDQHSDSVAYRDLVIRPILTDRFDHVTASFESPRGLIESGWIRTGEMFTITVTVPPGSTATVFLPKSTQAVGAGTHEFTTPRHHL